MAPKGTKRPAASSVGPRKKECKLVAKALVGNPMLSCVVAKTLGVYADERHEFQTKLVTMIGESLSTLQSSLEEAVATAQTAVDGAEAEKAAREKAVEDAEATLKAKEEALVAADETLRAATEAVSGATTALKDAEDAQKTGDAELAESTKMKEEVEAAYAKYGQMKEAAGAAPDIKDVKKVMDKLGCEEQALAFIPETLKKESSARGPFDAIIMKTIEDTLTAKISALTETLGSAETDTAARKAAVEAATTTLTAASDKQVVDKTAKDEAATAAKEARSALKDAKKAISTYESDMKSAEKVLASAKAKLAGFSDGALAAFNGLKDKVTPPPEPEKPEEPEPAEPAPAEEALPAPEVAA